MRVLRRMTRYDIVAWPILARFGRTPPTRARRLFDVSVDPTEARNRNQLHRRSP
jgi:hypothetical protein